MSWRKLADLTGATPGARTSASLSLLAPLYGARWAIEPNWPSGSYARYAAADTFGMAVAISTPSISESSAQAKAVSWTACSAGLALLMTVPLVLVLLRPVASVLFVRGTAHDGDWSHVLAMILVLLAPATYALFVGTTGELLKNRVSERIHRSTMRFAAAGLLPYLILFAIAITWQTGPQQPLLMVASLTIPVAMGATIWASGARVAAHS